MTIKCMDNIFSRAMDFTSKKKYEINGVRGAKVRRRNKKKVTAREIYS